MIDEERSELGNRLKLARTINKFTLDDVAKQIGGSKSALSLYESGNRTPSHDVLKKLASTYKVSLDFLAYGTFSYSPGQLLLDFNEVGRNIEVSKEEYEISSKLLTEKAKQVVCNALEKLGPSELIELLDVNEEDLRGMSYIYKSKSLRSSLTRLGHVPLNDLDSLADYIDEYEKNK